MHLFVVDRKLLDLSPLPVLDAADGSLSLSFAEFGRTLSQFSVCSIAGYKTDGELDVTNTFSFVAHKTNAT